MVPVILINLKWRKYFSASDCTEIFICKFDMLAWMLKDMVDLVRFYRWILSEWFKIQYFRCRKTCKKNFWKNRFLKAYCLAFKIHGSRSQKRNSQKLILGLKMVSCFQITLKNSSTLFRTSRVESRRSFRVKADDPGRKQTIHGSKQTIRAKADDLLSKRTIF